MQRRKSTRHELLRQRAIALRGASTSAEAALWRLLSRGQLGVRFRRQVVLCGRFIADFYAPARRLAVEVDGGYHADRADSDARRDRVLERAGYRVVRLSNELIAQDPAEAVRRVRVALG